MAEAEGAKIQAEERGRSYLEARQNEAKGIVAQGKAEVEGLVQQISALQGPGGRALLKLEIAKQLVKSNPQFVLLNEGQAGSGIEVKRTDTNELLNQIGVIEGLKPKESPPNPKNQ